MIIMFIVIPGQPCDHRLIPVACDWKLSMLRHRERSTPRWIMAHITTTGAKNNQTPRSEICSDEPQKENTLQKETTVQKRLERGGTWARGVKEHFVFWWRQSSHCGSRIPHSQTQNCPRPPPKRSGCPCRPLRCGWNQTQPVSQTPARLRRTAVCSAYACVSAGSRTRPQM